MHQKMEKALLSGINPLITGLIKEGMEQGICQTDYPEEVLRYSFGRTSKYVLNAAVNLLWLS